ncbi:MAG: hypothetical protein GIW95_09115, partial [Candidatus Eremiobacteraeota bacterium]|nr:hypothetical protein [Candidatus Eremiobacteraeota bacterium]
TERSLFAANDPDPEAVGIALARLEAALGPRSALRARLVAGNRYETRFTYEPFAAAERSRPSSDTAAAAERGTLAYRLLEAREINVTIEGGRPTRAGGRRVLEYAGPWRVNERWWADAYVSDAYDVALDDGALWRIVNQCGRWYLSGTYD